MNSQRIFVISYLLLVDIGAFREPWNIIRTAKHESLNKVRNKSEFFLRCPKIYSIDKKNSVNIAWIRNGKTVFSVIHEKTRHSADLEPITIKQWKTLNGDRNILANTSDIQFEYEEKRNWYVMRIKRISESNEGLWKCRMVVQFENKRVSRRYESGKNAQIRPELFTFKKRNLSADDQNDDINDSVTFTKPNTEFRVFSRMSRFNDIAYIRHESAESAFLNRNYSFISSDSSIKYSIFSLAYSVSYITFYRVFIL